LHAAKKIARVVSYLFIPPTFNLLGFIFLALVTQSLFSERLINISTAIIFAVVLPILFFFMLRKKKIITDNDAVIKEERYYPFYLYVLLNLCGFCIAFLLGSNSFIQNFWLVITLNTIGITLINYFWKISVHAIGVATFVALLYYFESGLYIYMLGLILVVGLSRYILKIHTPAQIIAGTFYGFIFTYLQLSIY
jgi:membrane-associated phospholipid phosphatase